MRPGRPTRVPRGRAGNQTVVIGLRLLKTLARSERPLPLTSIAQQTGLSPSRAHRYMASLCESGFAQQDQETGRYAVGWEAIELGAAAMAGLQGIDVAASAMSELTQVTGLVSYMCVWGSNGPTIIRREMGAVQTAVRVQEGSNLSMLTATGLVFLAHLPGERTSAILRRDLAAWAAESGEPALGASELEKLKDNVRRHGIARTTGMRNPTWTALSCPVFEGGDRLAMALTLIGVSSLFDTKLSAAPAQALKAAAARLSASLSLGRA